MKKIFTLISFVLTGFTVSAQCDIPAVFTGNTGSNMTVMLLPAFLSSLNYTSQNAYVVATTPDGMVVGSASIFGLPQQSLAIWGDDSSTTELDGAASGAVISLQLVDSDTTLFDLSISPIIYSTGGMAVQSEPSMQTSCGAPSGTEIEYQLIAGWNLIGYTGDLANNGIVSAMNSALSNGSTTEETFEIIKDVTGKFWIPGVDLLPSFTPGEGYMAFVYTALEYPTINFQQSTGYLSDIEYQLISGWNMFCFTGDEFAENGIVSAMNSALSNGSTTEETFEIIKDVTGKFWIPGVDLLPNFNSGEGYMAFVFEALDLPTINFHQE